MMPPSMMAITNMDTVVKGVTVSEEKMPVNSRGDTSSAMRIKMQASTQGSVDMTTFCCCTSTPQNNPAKEHLEGACFARTAARCVAELRSPSASSSATSSKRLIFSSSTALESLWLAIPSRA